MTTTINKRMTINLSICLAALAAIALLPMRAEAVTYYSQGSGAFNTLANWNSIRTGGGSSPIGFETLGDTFIIQNGHNMTQGTSLNFGYNGSGTPSKLQIENGGTLTANGAIIMSQYAAFQIDNGGTYVHNTAAAFVDTIFNGTESIGNDSTVVLKNFLSQSSLLPALGNVTIDGDFASNSSMLGKMTTINGTFKVVSTGTKTFSLTSISALAMTISGDMIIEGGSLNFVDAGGTFSITLGGNFTMTGGTLVNPDHACTLTFSGGASSVGFTQSGGTFNHNNINFTILASKTVTLNNNLSIAASRYLTVLSSGRLNCDNYIVNGAGAYTNFSGSALGIGSPDGITSYSVMSGNIQVSGWRYFSTGGADYNYNGGSVQVTGNGLPTTIRDFTINNSAGVTLSQGVSVSGTATVTGTLNCAGYNITGAGAFTLNPGATLGIGSTAGITSTAGSGNIQVTGTRTYSTSANYTYNGSSAQVTGNSLPATVNNLAINNNAGVTLSQAVTANGGVTMVAGTLKINGQIVTAADLSGAGTIENANATARTLTINKTSGSSTFSGVVQNGTGGGALALVKQGSGTLLLTGANTYSGATSVDAGTLGGAGSSSSATTVKSSATIAPGSTGIGTFNTGNLGLENNSLIICEIGSASNFDKVVANGELTLPTGFNKTRIEIPAGSTLTPNTTYDVISYSSLNLTGGDAANIQVDNFSDTLGVTASLVDNKVRLTTTPEPGMMTVAALALLALRRLSCKQ